MTKNTALLALAFIPAPLASQVSPEVPRIEQVVPLSVQPHGDDPAVIWYDDFDEDGEQERYAEKAGGTTDGERLGESGKSLEMRYPKGRRGVGNRKVVFGDSPVYRAKAVRSDDTFTDVYWRVYVKHEAGWKGGGPAKLSRATSFTSSSWTQAMIAHVWSSGEALTLDPATGVEDGEVVTRKYNDFERLDWLGNRPASRMRVHSVEESGRWVCIEARAKLNTPGRKDGLQQLWIDGRLEAERRNLDWRGTYDDHGINAVFLEAYWNEGSPVDQSRWIDEFVISTEPVGPLVAPVEPVIVKTPYQGPGDPGAWRVEISADGDGGDVVWRSGELTTASRVRVGERTGTFTGSRADAKRLARGHTYFVRVRQRSAAGAWSDWSPWHQPFRTESSE